MQRPDEDTDDMGPEGRGEQGTVAFGAEATPRLEESHA